MANRTQGNQPNQTGSQSGNPRNQQVQRDQVGTGNSRNIKTRDGDAPRRRRGNSSGGDGNRGGNR
ncbi:MAG TPA: hypothetical protein VFZ78_11950 [Flavisolibacter sp.]